MSCNREKMHTGELYEPYDPEIMAWQVQRLNRLYDFNMELLQVAVVHIFE